MPIDTSIYNNIQLPKFQTPFEIAQGAEQIRGLQNQNRLADLTYGQAQQDVASQNALSGLLSSGRTGNDVVQGLAQQGYGKQGLAYGKSMLDQQKTQAEIGHLGAQTNQSNASAGKSQIETAKDVNGLMGSAAYAIAQNPTYENAVAITNDLKSKLPPDIAAKIDVSQIPNDPAVIKQRAISHYMATVDVAKQVENQTSIANNSANNATHILTTKMSNDTSRANNASTIAGENTRAGFDLNGNSSGDMETTARAIANGQLPPPSGMALTNPKNQRILSRVMEINPQYDFTDVTAKKKAASDFTSGNQGNALRSFAVAGQHLDQLGSLVDALNNRDTQLFNKIGNQYSTQTGNAAPTNFNAAKDVVAKEVMKAIVGGGGGVSEREELAKSMSQVNSPAQLKGVISQYRNLMSAQHDALMEQRRAAGLSDSTLPKYSNSNPAQSNDIHAQADAILGRK